jgi:hypothetical protein
MENKLVEEDKDLLIYIKLFENYELEDLLVELRNPESKFTLSEPVESKESLLTELYQVDNIYLFTCGRIDIDYEELFVDWEETDEDFGLDEDDYDPQDDYGEIGKNYYKLNTECFCHTFIKETPFGVEEFDSSEVKD